MVEILMATYNGEKYIREQLDSIMKQSYQDFRVLIRDDGSSDRTVDIVREYESLCQGKIKLIFDNNQCGSSVSNFFQLIKYAEADYIMFSDQDDYWLSEKVKITFNRMQEIEKRVGTERPILVFADYKAVDSELKDLNFKAKNNQVSACKTDFCHLLVQNYVTGCLTMLNKSLYRKLGTYCQSILMHDWWAALYASAVGEISHIEETVMLYRQHGDNCVGVVDVRSINYIKNKILNNNTKNSKYKYWEQAKCFYDRYNLELNQKCWGDLNTFLEIETTKLKLRRVYRLIKGRYLKSDFIRSIGQLWYI